MQPLDHAAPLPKLSCRKLRQSDRPATFTLAVSGTRRHCRGRVDRRNWRRASRTVQSSLL